MEAMQEEQSESKTSGFIQTEHPWLELQDSTLDEDMLYILDEIRFA